MDGVDELAVHVQRAGDVEHELELALLDRRILDHAHDVAGDDRGDLVEVDRIVAAEDRWEGRRDGDAVGLRQWQRAAGSGDGERRCGDCGGDFLGDGGHAPFVVPRYCVNAQSRSDVAAALRASSVGAPRTATMMRRPTRLAEATMQ